MAAALFAVNQGLSVVQVGMTAEIVFASGCLDLLGIYPLGKKVYRQNPWSAIAALAPEAPRHPYARLQREELEGAFAEVLSFLQGMKLPYQREPERNLEVITPIGTVRPTYCVPETMWEGVRALREKAPCLLVDFKGLADFSAPQIVAVLKDHWPGLHSARISVPGTVCARTVSTGEPLALTLEMPDIRERLAEEVIRHLKGAEAVGFPAVLGLSRSRDVVSELGDRIGVPVFEIPTPPISVPGLRLSEAFTEGLTRRGLRNLPQMRVTEIRTGVDGEFRATVGDKAAVRTVKARGVVLASGRFWGGGLYAGRQGIRETIFDLPVYQPGSRREWHLKDFLDPRGHPANRAGLETDNMFRPLGISGRPAFDTLFAVGSVLGHQDWIRTKCGAGLAFGTAHRAVKAFTNLG